MSHLFAADLLFQPKIASLVVAEKQLHMWLMQMNCDVTYTVAK